MPRARLLPPMVAMVMALAAACTQSSMSADPTLSRVAEAAEEVLAGLPPLCTTLRTEGFETRKATVDDATETERRLVEHECPGALDRLHAGEAVERAAARLDGEKVTIAFDRCAATTTGFEAAVTITNDESRAVGVYAVVRPSRGGDPVGVGGLALVWHLPPGESATRQITGSGSGDRCAVEFNVFLADRSLGGDGAAAVPASPEVADDDPAVWFPALVAAEREWAQPDADDVDGPSRTEDLRSTAYRRLVDAIRDGRATAPAGGTTLCSTAAKRDDPGLVRVIARQGDRLVAGVVRRGHDGGWRWLGTTLVLGPGPCP